MRPAGRAGLRRSSPLAWVPFSGANAGSAHSTRRAPRLTNAIKTEQPGNSGLFCHYVDVNMC